MNEGEIELEEKTKEERCERFKTLPSSLSNNDETLHLIMNKLHEQRFSWKFHGINSLYSTFYFVDESKMNVGVRQLMCCVICYNNVVLFIVFNQRGRLTKHLV
jgi:hypothetical protein